MGVRVVCEVRLWVGSRENVTRPEERTELLADNEIVRNRFG